MASEAVKKILSAENSLNLSISENKKIAEEIINEAEKHSALTIQKRISQAVAETENIRSDYMKKIEIYRQKSENDCLEKIEEIRSQAEKNILNAVNTVINEFF